MVLDGLHLPKYITIPAFTPEVDPHGPSAISSGSGQQTQPPGRGPPESYAEDRGPRSGGRYILTPEVGEGYEAQNVTTPLVSSFQVSLSSKVIIEVEKQRGRVTTSIPWGKYLGKSSSHPCPYPT